MVYDLSVSLQNYINVVYELSSCGEGARISDIAAGVGVSKASTCNAVKSLEERRLVYRDSCRLVLLTEEGRDVALLARDKALIIRRFFIDVLGVDPEIADSDARALEHIVSFQTLCVMCRLSNRANTKRKCREGCHLLTDCGSSPGT